MQIFLKKVSRKFGSLKILSIFVPVITTTNKTMSRMSTKEIYAKAEALTQEEYESLYSKLSKESKEGVQSLIRLGDSPSLALITEIAYRIDEETLDFYRNAYES